MLRPLTEQWQWWVPRNVLNLWVFESPTFCVLIFFMLVIVLFIPYHLCNCDLLLRGLLQAGCGNLGTTNLTCMYRSICTFLFPGAETLFSLCLTPSKNV